MNDAVALARRYIKIGDDKAADLVLDKAKQIFPVKEKSILGTLLNASQGELYLEKNDYKKVEEIIIETDKLIQENGFNMIEAKKERILAELHEKKGDWKKALEHYYASIDSPPG